jgi:hypothetical protein
VKEQWKKTTTTVVTYTCKNGHVSDPVKADAEPPSYCGECLHDEEMDRVLRVWPKRLKGAVVDSVEIAEVDEDNPDNPLLSAIVLRKRGYRVTLGIHQSCGYAWISVDCEENRQ